MELNCKNEETFLWFFLLYFLKELSACAHLIYGEIPSDIPRVKPHWGRSIITFKTLILLKMRS